MRQDKTYRSPYSTFGLAAAGIVLVLGLLLVFWLGWNLYWAWAVVINVVTFLFFRFDKRRAAAQKGETRVPELVLLALVAVGGVLGGLAGMLMRPRHKVHKPLFWVVLVVSAALHAYLLFAWPFA